MGTLNQPGAYNCLEKLQANPDMPYFLLLGKDPAAPGTVRHWASHAMVNGASAEKVSEALRVAEQMEDYQREHAQAQASAPG